VACEDLLCEDAEGWGWGQPARDGGSSIGQFKRDPDKYFRKFCKIEK